MPRTAPLHVAYPVERPARDPGDDSADCWAVLRDGMTIAGDPMPVRVSSWFTLFEADIAAMAAAVIWGRAWIEHWYMGRERNHLRSQQVSRQRSDVIRGYWCEDGEHVNPDPMAGPTESQLA